MIYKWHVLVIRAIEPSENNRSFNQNKFMRKNFDIV